MGLRDDLLDQINELANPHIEPDENTYKDVMIQTGCSHPTAMRIMGDAVRKGLCTRRTVIGLNGKPCIAFRKVTLDTTGDQ